MRRGRKKRNNELATEKEKNEGEGQRMQIQAMKDAVQWEPKQLHCSYSKLENHTFLLSYTSTNAYYFIFSDETQIFQSTTPQ